MSPWRTHELALAALLLCGCGGDSPPAQPIQPTGQAKSKAKAPAGKTLPARKGYDPPLLYAKKGIHYEVFALGTKPYDGKLVTYHDAAKKNVKTEKEFANGKLLREKEFWPNNRPKLEIDYTGTEPVTKEFDRQGKPKTPPLPPITPTAPGRLQPWISASPKNIRYNQSLEYFYTKQTTNTIFKVFGQPDVVTTNLWLYRGLNITDAKTGRKKTTVRFLFGGFVTNVMVTP